MLPGISGSLLPARYVADRLLVDAGVTAAGEAPTVVLDSRRLRLWWQRVEASCGPATGVRALFDLAAMPLASLLGYRATVVEFSTGRALTQMRTPLGVDLPLIVSRWSDRSPSIWREAAVFARRLDARWCLVLAPPHLAVVDAGSHWTRRAVEFRFPDVLDAPESRAALAALGAAGAFELGAAGVSRIERLAAAAAAFQDRVRADLQVGVHEALTVLTPVLAGADPRTRRLPAAGAAFAEALTVVYRVLFLLFVESRHLVPWRHDVYRAYSITSLCREALADQSGQGAWAALAATTRLLRRGCTVDDLIVRPFNGRLFARASAPSLERAGRRAARRSAPRDQAMASALVSLSTRRTPGGRDPITYADLGVEQLGAVYERVLDWPAADEDQGSSTPRLPSPRRGHSARRKQTGTFYTPRALTELVVRLTLRPLVAGARSDRILELRVLDPAMGSGAFLVAACRYLAEAYERALISEGRLSDADVDGEVRASLRRRVAQHCLYGVDANPVAVQLARLSLWLTTLSRGKPLSFLDHRLRAGNSLVGASPGDLRRVRALGRRDAATLPLFDPDLEHAAAGAVEPLAALDARGDDTLGDVRAKETLWARLEGDRSPLSGWRRAADLWCARWFWTDDRPPSSAEVRAAVDAWTRRDRTLAPPHLERARLGASRAATRHGFFHWALEFADLFYGEDGRPRAEGGFDAVIGNPPWEMVRNDKTLGPGPALEDRASSRALVRFIRESGQYPSCDRGHVNLYQPFLERALSLVRAGGRVGLVLPWGLATDDGAAALRTRLFDRCATEAIVGLDNARGLFPVHRGLRFMALVTSPGGRTAEVRARFGLSDAAAIDALPDEDAEAEAGPRPIGLTPALLERVSGPARRIPDVRRAADLDLLDTLTCRFPPLGDAAGWRARFGRELNATEDRGSFGAAGLPVVEGKHIQPFRVRWPAGRADPKRIRPSEAARLLPDGRHERERLVYRDVSGVGNRLALIAAVMPARHVTTHTLFCLRTPLPVERQRFLCGVLNSFVVNLLVRLLMGSHVTTSLLERLPAPVWTGAPDERLVADLARRLARGPAAEAEAHLQAAVARLYGLDAATFKWVLDAFPLVPAEARRAAAAAMRLEMYSQ